MGRIGLQQLVNTKKPAETPVVLRGTKSWLPASFLPSLLNSLFNSFWVSW